MARGDLKSPLAIYVKGLGFVLIALLASGLLLAEQFSLRTALLLAIAIWASCRAYYFAFYVIEHYVDPDFRFSGLWDFLRYCLGHPRR